MGWRMSYDALLELFPQVDPRLIKGAALEHGDDVSGAAEFIINEVLESHETALASQGRLDANRAGSNDFQDGREPATGKGSEIYFATGLVASPNFEGAEEATVIPLHGVREPPVESGNTLVGCCLKATTRSDFGDSFETAVVLDPGYGLARDDQELRNFSVEAGEDISETIVQRMSPGQNKKSSNAIQMSHEATGIQLVKAENSRERFGLSESSDSVVLSRGHFGQSKEDSVIATAVCDGKLRLSSLDIEDSEAGVSSFSSAMDGFPGGSEDGRLQDGVTGESNRNKALPGGALEVSLQYTSHSEVAPESSHIATETLKARNAQNTQFTPASFSSGPIVNVQIPNAPISQSESNIIQAFPRDAMTEEDNSEGATFVQNADSFYGVIHSESARETPTVKEGILDAKSFMSMNSMDATEWENIHSGSICSIRIEVLDDLVEEAKSEKEDLINAIETIRGLRIKTDQAEYIARLAKAEAARGGAEVLSKVEEMRQLLSKAREANAVHAGEVCGEKAVLATEARELQLRLVKVKEEKAKALSALNEIKSFLQIRFENANSENDAAKLEKTSKEALAKEALATEESLMAKVAQESRDLEAESDACTKLREFLFDRGATVDALQGEVAVLWEDAESLKKDLDGLSCSGAYVHMMSRQGSSMFKKLGSDTLYSTGTDISKSSSSTADVIKSDSQQYVQIFPAAVENEVTFHNNLSEIASQARGYSLVSGNDKKSWSSIPSLIGALSGSQDMTSSSHSAQSTKSSSRNFAVNPHDSGTNFEADKLRAFLFSPDNIEGVVDSSPQVSEVRMAMFPGEELEPEYSGNHTLDIFRVEKSEESESGQAEDWHLLDGSILSKRFSSSSSASSCTSK